tara:strand:+ start:5979 stop:6476 length:498 start_codon:yes stop_codon:yes gene_type:complete
MSRRRYNKHAGKKKYRSGDPRPQIIDESSDLPKDEEITVFDDLEPGDMIMCVPSRWGDVLENIHEKVPDTKIWLKNLFSTWRSTSGFNYVYARPIENSSKTVSINFGQTGIYLGICHIKSRYSRRTKGHPIIKKRRAHCCWIGGKKVAISQKCIQPFSKIANLIK